MRHGGRLGWRRNAHEADANGSGLWVVVIRRHVDAAAFGIGDVHLLGAFFPGNGGLGVLRCGGRCSRGNRRGDTNGDRSSSERGRKLRRKSIG